MKKLITFLSLAVACFGTQAQSLYGDMEVWRTYTVGFSPTQLESVRGWNCPDSLVYTFGPLLNFSGKFNRMLFKTTDAHSGTYAAKVVTADEDTLGIIPGVMTNATINIDISNQDFSLSGGTPVSGRINYVNAWIKYVPVGGDSANVVAAAILEGAASDGTDSILGIGTQVFAATPAYTLVSIPLTYDDPNAIPDNIQVIFTSSGQSATVGSTLFVDDVSYTLFPASVGNVTGSNAVMVYPNPANSTLYIKAAAGNAVTWQATGISGQVVATKSINGSESIDVSAYTPGLYFYTVTDAAGNIVQRSRFTISR